MVQQIVNMYFVRSKEDKEQFMHPADANDPFGKKYILKEGAIGACVWSTKNVKAFIEECHKQGKKVESVLVKDVLDLSANPLQELSDFIDKIGREVSYTKNEPQRSEPNGFLSACKMIKEEIKKYQK